MAITPAGKTRVMVAQSYSNPLSEGYSESPSVSTQQGPLSFDTGDAMNEDVGAAPTEGSSQDAPVAPKSKKKTLTNYVYEKLLGYGYPGRRLEEFKTKFVKESVSPQGVKDIQIEIPDKKYPTPEGVSDTIENSDLKQIAKEIQEQFGLNFNGADRSDGKWTIKFTSEKMTSPDEQGQVVDNLEEVYGSPSMKGKGGAIQKEKGRKAYTIQELMKQAKNNVVDKLIKILGV